MQMSILREDRLGFRFWARLLFDNPGFSVIICQALQVEPMAGRPAHPNSLDAAKVYSTWVRLLDEPWSMSK